MADNQAEYDAIVIGSGQGGNPLTQQLAVRGERVALVERNRLGGTCINTGCTPTKMYVASAQVAHYARNAARWGVGTGDVRVDLPAVLRRKKEFVQKSRSNWQKKFDGSENLHLYHGSARFVAPRVLQVNGNQLRGKHVFIDTGTNSTIPALPGLQNLPYLTNESLLELTEIPPHLLILGAGYIGLEFSQIFRRFGSKVTVIGNATQILTQEDKEIADALQQALEAEGIEFYLEQKVDAAEGREGSVLLRTDKGEVFQGSHLLLAVGRKPNTQDLDLARGGVETDARGYIRVNERLETTAENTWALGDVKGGPAFTHISYNDYQIIYGNLYEGKQLRVSDRLVPYAVFTDPQLGRVGQTEKQARAAGKRIKVGTMAMSSVARAIERAETAGLMKIVVDTENDQLLGAAILGSEGGELVQILSTLMLAKQPYTLLKGAIYIHPTLAEGFFGLMESVQ